MPKTDAFRNARRQIGAGRNAALMEWSCNRMTVECQHCGRPQEIANAAPGTEVKCADCGEMFVVPSAQSPAGRYVFAAVLGLIAVLALLLVNPGGSEAGRGMRKAVFGKAIAGKLGGNGDGPGNGHDEGSRAGDGGNGNGDGNGKTGNGANEEGSDGTATGRSSNGSNANRAPSGANTLTDPQATNNETSSDASIGRLGNRMGSRREGADIRAGAAGTDDPAERVGNSRTGMITNAPSAGANPGNSASRNSVETPEGSEEEAGPGSGANASGPLLGANTATNAPHSNALLLDDFSERLRQAGARSGDVQVSLEWKNINDLDLHVFDPNNEEIFYNHRQSQSGGLLDVDMNAAQLTERPVENVYWPERGALPGRYRVEVVHFANHGARDPTVFTVRVVNKGQVTYFQGSISYRAVNFRVRVPVCAFDVR